MKDCLISPIVDHANEPIHIQAHSIFGSKGQYVISNDLFDHKYLYSNRSQKTIDYHSTNFVNKSMKVQ